MKPRIRTGLLANFRETVLALGGDPDLIVERAGLQWDDLEKPDSFIPYMSYLQLLHNAALLTACPHFGLELSRSLGPMHFGVVGFVMSQAVSFGDAWRSFSRFYHVHDTYGVVGVREHKDTAYITYEIPNHTLPGARQSLDMAAGIATNINRMLYGPEFHATELHLPYPRPADCAPYERLQVASTFFGESGFAIGFEAQILSTPIAETDPLMRTILVEYLATLEESGQHRHSRQIEGLISQLLPTGRCTLEHIANFLSISVRTAQNRLSAEHTSFQQLLEKVRREQAIHHLSKRDMSLTQLAYALGYSELSAFSRSFKRWYGCSPALWQKKANQPQGV